MKKRRDREKEGDLGRFSSKAQDVCSLLHVQGCVRIPCAYCSGICVAAAAGWWVSDALKNPGTDMKGNVFFCKAFAAQLGGQAKHPELRVLLTQHKTVCSAMEYLVSAHNDCRLHGLMPGLYL